MHKINKLGEGRRGKKNGILDRESREGRHKEGKGEGQGKEEFPLQCCCWAELIAGVLCSFSSFLASSLFQGVSRSIERAKSWVGRLHAMSQ